jgi:hypothetical protein
MNEKIDWKTLTLVIGGTVGLLTGLAAAYLVIKQREEGGKILKLTSGDGAKIGMGIVSLLKTISDTGHR